MCPQCSAIFSQGIEKRYVVKVLYLSVQNGIVGLLFIWVFGNLT